MNTSLKARREKISRALDAIKDPLSGKGLLETGRIQGLDCGEDGKVRFTIEAPTGSERAFGAVRDAAEKAVASVHGVTKVTAVLTAHAAAKAAPTPARQAEGVAGVRSVIAVASGKGGVGKSTVAANLACALAANGLKVGLLDVDVYGPSLPTLFGIAAQKPAMRPDKKLDPIVKFGLKLMSIGFIVDPEQAMIWRGAMATSAVRQLIDDVAWGTDADPLDVLVLDMPPGTGDVQLTIAQRLPLAGAVIVSTPQELALADVRRGIAMFEKTHVPVIGIIENMSWLETPAGRMHIFGEGGARRTAEALGAPFLGEIPIDVSLRESADNGAPFVATHPDHALSKAFRTMAAAAMENAARAVKPAPVIRFE
ncbi:MAG: Mrp/NBP35 family ATP-binding protein [Hyphomonadaceae bacterium]|nr:MAG: ATP-binding protein involved in chromosome partitioning [Caulobacteraceae bacterium]MBT9444593.1 Mrp/NBP35 family ATP-binding protein [Hyphomonadaceae bacterium]